MTEPENLDSIWKALADPTRRKILDLLREEKLLTGAIVSAFPGLTRGGVIKHLEILRQAGLVITTEEGRTRVNRLNPVPIQAIYERWVRGFEGHRATLLLDLQKRSS